MLEFTPNEARFLAGCVRSFSDSFDREVAAVVAGAFRGAQPPSVTETLEALTLLLRQLELVAPAPSPSEGPKPPVRVHALHQGLLRRVLIEQRRRTAEAVEVPAARSTDPDVINHLHRELRPYEGFMAADWFREAPPQRLPQLADFVSVRHVESMLSGVTSLAERDYDEKFHILEAPRLFWSDLSYYRQHCGWRDVPLVIAFADIDNFKDYNTKLGETRVDREVLTPFMEALEAHVFARGHAYRFGGDEYVLVLPNQTEDEGVRVIQSLQERLQMQPYRIRLPSPSISVGLCVVVRDTVLTNREVLEAANRAKTFAKDRCKGSIAVSVGPTHGAGDLRLAELAVDAPRPAPAAAGGETP